MSGWVIDSSVAIAWVHPGQATARTNELLAEVENGAAITVPPLWFFEVANALLTAKRRHRITAEERLIALEKLSSLRMAVDMESDRAALAATSKLAEEHGLTVYDAAYLELAICLKLSLSSKDEPLREAARRSGVKLL